MEMKKSGQLLLLSLLTLLYCSCQSVTVSPEVKRIITQIRKVCDPQGKLANIDTQVVKGEFRSNTTEKPMTMAMTFKKPDMMKVKIVVPGEVTFVKAYNGKQGWLFSPEQGVVQLEGKQLHEMKLQAMLLNPMPKLTQIFTSIKLQKESIEVGELCYTFVCTPKPEFNSQPITFYVSKKSYHIIKREELIDTADGKIDKVITVFNNYKPTDGILVAHDIISFRNGKLMEFNVKSVEWNAELSTDDFNMPNELK